MTKRPRTARTADAATRLYAAIRQRAINYDFRPGERINEVELATEMACSRTPVREALNRLVVEGLVTIVPNKGFYCRTFDADEILSLFEVRAGLEVKAVELACERAADADLAELHDWARAVTEAVEGASVENLTRDDELFHNRIAAAGGNQELVRFLEAINVRIRFVRRIEIGNRRATAFGEHIGIAGALVDRDVAEARRLMSRHIDVSVSDAVATVKEGLARIYMRKHSA